MYSISIFNFFFKVPLCIRTESVETLEKAIFCSCSGKCREAERSCLYCSCLIKMLIQLRHNQDITVCNC